MAYMDKVREKIEEPVENYKRSRTSLRKTIAEGVRKEVGDSQLSLVSAYMRKM